MNENKIYTTADFERYHAGTMPAAEMHAMEKAALDDPFLADALEGYTNTSSFESDITELKERLDKRKGKKIFSISSITQSGWWRIAALFIVIAGAGYFFYKMNSSNKENPIAINESKAPVKKADSAMLSGNESTAANNDVAFENHQARRFEEKQETTLPKLKPEGKATTPSEEKEMQPEPAAPVMESKKDFANSEINKINADNDHYAAAKQDSSKFLLKGKITDEKGYPVAFATIRDTSERNITVTDTAGNFFLRTPDSNTTAIVSAVGYSTKKITLQKDKQPTIVINANKANLDEVVVTAYGSERKKTVTGAKEDEPDASLKELQGKAAGIEITQPLANTEKFDQYIKENATAVYNENNEPQKGEVFLSFITGKDGKPYKIKVIKSSCSECENAAIKLLKNGAVWDTFNNKRRTVIIKF